jgi:hypothetical protein
MTDPNLSISLTTDLSARAVTKPLQSVNTIKLYLQKNINDITDEAKS